jgi:hypothetical protein
MFLREEQAEIWQISSTSLSILAGRSSLYCPASVIVALRFCCRLNYRGKGSVRFRQNFVSWPPPSDRSWPETFVIISQSFRLRLPILSVCSLGFPVVWYRVFFSVSLVWRTRDFFIVWTRFCRLNGGGGYVRTWLFWFSSWVREGVLIEGIVDFELVFLEILAWDPHEGVDLLHVNILLVLAFVAGS